MYDASATSSVPPEHSIQNSEHYSALRAAAGDILELVQLDYQRAAELAQHSHRRPLTGLERLELSSLYSMLGNAFIDVAELWGTYRADPDDPELGIAEAYRRHAEALHDAAALHEAVVAIAPAHEADDPFARR